ncbi:MAG: hypothetical protein GYA87_08235 [Christensenellaceae bacterium]|nr:hypothetical protein [Christensenellaceae bacterium]
MKRKISTLLTFLILSLLIIPSSLAHDDQAKHDADLMCVFWGDDKVSLSSEEKIAFKIIANAAAITIDQYSLNPNGRIKEGTFNEIQEGLKYFGLPELSINFNDIDLNIKVSNDGKNISPNTHRLYTHLGWNYKKHPNNDFWKKRKHVLIDSVNRLLFNSKKIFSWFPWASDVVYPPSEQCDAFCAIIYYVHIIGDHIAGDTADKLKNIEPLIHYTSMDTPGIIVELKEQLQIVFQEQKNSYTFFELDQKLSDLTISIEKNCDILGFIDTAEKCKKNQEHAEQLLQILSKHLPTLLKNESFFKSRFK